jgi:hypothetical protein
MWSAWRPVGTKSSEAQTKALVISATYPDSQGEMLQSPISRRGPRSSAAAHAPSRAVDGALAADTKVGTGRAMSASACGRMSPSETGVGAITPFALVARPAADARATRR